MTHHEQYVIKAHHRIEQDLDGMPFRDVCIKLVDFLTSNKAKRLTHITVGTLRTVLSRSELSDQQNALLLSAANYLAGGRLHLLDMKFQYIDESTEDPVFIDSDHLSETVQTGRFYHPLTGEEVMDYKSYIFPYFEPSSELSELHER